MILSDGPAISRQLAPWPSPPSSARKPDPFDLGEQGEQSDRHISRHVRRSVDSDVPFHGPEPNRPFSQGIEQGDDLPDRAAEPGKLAGAFSSPASGRLDARFDAVISRR